MYLPFMWGSLRLAPIIVIILLGHCCASRSRDHQATRSHSQDQCPSMHSCGTPIFCTGTLHTHVHIVHVHVHMM